MAVIQNIELKTTKGKLIYKILFVLLIAGIFVQFFPMFWMVMGTFKTDNELVKAVPSIFPAVWKFENYREAFSRYHIWDNLLNTLILCGSIILLQVGNSAIAAYSLSKMKPRFGSQVLLIFMGTMMFSGTALMFPLYIMMTNLHLVGSKWALILSSSAWAYSIFLFKTFFDNIPAELMESAKIDGASDLNIFRTIILPLSKPVLGVNILNTFMAVYNDFLYPLMMLPNEKDWTIMIRIYMLDKLGTVPPSSMYVLLTVATIPVLIIYLFVQKNITEGISTTGIKG